MNLKNNPIIKENINALSKPAYDEECFKDNNFYLKKSYEENVLEIKATFFHQKAIELGNWGDMGCIQLYLNRELVDEFHISNCSKTDVLLDGFSFFTLEKIIAEKEKLDNNTHIFKPVLIDIFTAAYYSFIKYTFSPDLLNEMAALNEKSQLKIHHFLFYNKSFNFSNYKNLCEFFILSYDHDITNLLHDPYSIDRVEKKLTNKKISFS